MRRRSLDRSSVKASTSPSNLATRAALPSSAFGACGRPRTTASATASCCRSRAAAAPSAAMSSTTFSRTRATRLSSASSSAVRRRCTRNSSGWSWRARIAAACAAAAAASAAPKRRLSSAAAEDSSSKSVRKASRTCTALASSTRNSPWTRSKRSTCSSALCRAARPLASRSAMRLSKRARAVDSRMTAAWNSCRSRSTAAKLASSP
mmetsp:Transcript_119830/g.346269  ORF Transcript_119830/g.346269 Transcript_119830/m.346269 type:complete len:207 (+) Transcript_119830:331-951(+)